VKSRKPTASEKLVMALPNGRILDEAMPLLRRAGIEPEAAFSDPNARQLPLPPPIPGSN